MRRVVFRKNALNDLERLYAYIRDQDGSPINAYGVVQRIRARCDSLADFPEQGTRRDDIRPGLRILSFERTIVIAFAIDDQTVRISRIFYGGRNYEKLLATRR
jgi:toxin ParE1/3/4